ncbi:MAG: type II secretion system minor pseudopilin GspH [Spongiibacteraceae bacterium]
MQSSCRLRERWWFNSNRPQAQLRYASGFTLLEILVTLVIVAAMAAMLVFSFKDSSQQKLQREASDFAVVLNAAADEAVMRGIEIGVVLDDEGYRFVVFDPETKRWQAPTLNGLAEHKFPERYLIEFSLDGSDVDEQVIERIKLLAQRSDDERLRPSILILSSGEVTPFSLTLSSEDKDSGEAAAIISLHSDGLNPVVVTKAGVNSQDGVDKNAVNNQSGVNSQNGAQDQS